jgi:hypothetical protein
MIGGTIKLHISAGTDDGDARRRWWKALGILLRPKPRWHVFDERLLRDIGKTPYDAEWEALRQAWGSSRALDDLKSRIDVREAFRRIRRYRPNWGHWPEASRRAD